MPNRLFISFSGRSGGNCDQIARFLADADDQILCFRDLQAHPCSLCHYECFTSECPYRADGIYTLYSKMITYDQTVLIVPMYCGNPSSLYFMFNERCQDYFMHHDTWNEIIRRLYIIGVYSSQEASPDFIPCLSKWFDGTNIRNHVLGVERHLYGQQLQDSVLDVPEVQQDLRDFLPH